MLKVTGLSHDYEGKGHEAVTDITFQIAEGEIFGFLGPSGAGKSTVQNIMTGLLKIQKGSVTYDDTSVTDLKKPFYNKIGVSFEQPNLYPSLTGEENLRYFAGLFSVPTMDPTRALELVGLRDSAKKKASDYSKGMKQRLVFARALLNDPHYLFLDEPTSGLDPSTASRICDLMLEQRKQGKVIFLTTHNMELADRLCDRVAFLEGGRIRAMDSPYNLKLQFGTHALKVTYREGGHQKQAVLDMEKDKPQITKLINSGTIDTIHSSEATLEDIFIKITGRGLSA